MQCVSCGKQFNPDKWHPFQKYCSKKCGRKHYYETHKEKWIKSLKYRDPAKKREWDKNYRIRHHDREVDRVAEWRKKYKMMAFKHYSPELKCNKCGINDMRVLSIDHINGDGWKDRQKGSRRGSGWNFCRWLIKNGYPEGYQVLCMNCQFIKRHENDEQTKRVLE